MLFLLPLDIQYFIYEYGGKNATDKFAATKISYMLYYIYKIYCSVMVDGFGSFIDIMCPDFNRVIPSFICIAFSNRQKE